MNKSKAGQYIEDQIIPSVNIIKLINQRLDSLEQKINDYRIELNETNFKFHLLRTEISTLLYEPEDPANFLVN